MSNETVEVLVIGGGQAGLAMSEHLRAGDVSHLVLERHGIAERWRSERWDSLVANGPAWHDRFPGLEFDLDPDGFASKEQVADYFVTYAEKIEAPIRCGVEVISVAGTKAVPAFGSKLPLGRSKRASGGRDRRVPASGLPADPPCGRPGHAASLQRVPQPGTAPDGAVLVVGAGSSGTQIADELLRAGRRVYLSVAPMAVRRAVSRPRLLLVAGRARLWDLVTPPAGAEHVTIAVSGAYGGNTVDFRKLAARGMCSWVTSLRERLIHSHPTSPTTSPRAMPTIALLEGRRLYRAQRPRPPEGARSQEIGPDPDRVTKPLRELDLKEAGITSIIWATGFVQISAGSSSTHSMRTASRSIAAASRGCRGSISWDCRGSRRGSRFIWGVWHDARYIADQIVTRNGYLAYDSAKSASEASPAG